MNQAATQRPEVNLRGAADTRRTASVEPATRRPLHGRGHRLMVRLALRMALAVVAFGLALAGPPRVTHAAAGSREAESQVFLALSHPCTTESALLPGVVSIRLEQKSGGYTIHYKLEADGTGSAGNRYNVSFNGSERFSSPSAISDSFVAFDVPFHAVVITRGAAPNFAIRGTIRVLTETGPEGLAIVGSQIFSVTSQACRG